MKTNHFQECKEEEIIYWKGSTRSNNRIRRATGASKKYVEKKYEEKKVFNMVPKHSLNQLQRLLKLPPKN